jgi:hypothetical protein
VPVAGLTPSGSRAFRWSLGSLGLKNGSTSWERELGNPADVPDIQDAVGMQIRLSSRGAARGSRYLALGVVPLREEVALLEVFDDGISEWAA